MLKTDFLKRLALVTLSTPLAILQPMAKADPTGESDALVGLWEAVVKSAAATYRYIYSISPGSYVATGSIDENFMDFKYSPTMGAYTRNANGSYKYRERGFVFDMKGTNTGTFTSVGAFRLDVGGNAFRGPGVFTQYDLKSNAVATERFTMQARRLPV